MSVNCCGPANYVKKHLVYADIFFCLFCDIKISRAENER